MSHLGARFDNAFDRRVADRLADLKTMNALNGKHIVIVPAWWPSPEQPHAGVFFQDYVEAFTNAGAKVGVIYPDLVGLRQLGRGERKPLAPRILHETTVADAPVVRIRGLQTSFGSVERRALRFRDWLARGLAAYRDRHGEPDILHAMCAVPAGWACTNLNDPLSRRVVLTEHTGPFTLVMDPPDSAKLARTAFESAAMRVAVSDHLRRQIQEAGIRNTIEVCGNPVSSHFAPATRTPPAGHKRIRGLFVGRLTQEKGVSTLVSAIAEIRNATPHCEFHFVGNGPLGVAIAPFLAAEDAAILHHASCPRAEVCTHMQNADFLVHPSMEETFGMTVAEALCVGLPVVTTRGTACAEFIDDDNGILVERGDEASLEAGLRQMIDTCRDYDRAAIAAKARERFSGNAVAMIYNDIFDRILDAN